MWLTSNRPAPRRVARCSAMIPVRYCTGIRHPAKSTIFPPWPSCRSCNTVLFKGWFIGYPGPSDASKDAITDAKGDRWRGRPGQRRRQAGNGLVPCRRRPVARSLGDSAARNRGRPGQRVVDERGTVLFHARGGSIRHAGSGHVPRSRSRKTALRRAGPLVPGMSILQGNDEFALGGVRHRDAGNPVAHPPSHAPEPGQSSPAATADAKRWAGQTSMPSAERKERRPM